MPILSLACNCACVCLASHWLPLALWGSGHPSKITAEMKKIVEEQMQLDEETTAHQLHQLLMSKSFNISLRMVLWCCSCTSLGWTFRGSAYYQLIREVKKAKRLQWAVEHQDLNFDDVVWTDECTIQLESYQRFCCRKVGQQPRNKPRY